MKVILLQDINKIGKKFDIKEISSGYAVNFLLPKKLAILATGKTVRETEEKKKLAEKTKKIETEEIKKEISKMKDTPIEMKVKTNAEGKLFAKLSAQEIAEAIKKQNGLEIDPTIIELKKPLKEIGKYSINIKVGGEKNKIVLVVRGEEK